MHSFLLYIDPGTGSLLAQAILAGAIAGWVLFKNNIKRFFFRSKPGEELNNKNEKHPD